MKTNLTLITLLTCVLVVVMTVPSFAQRGGLGAGIGLGGGARVGTGAGAEVGGATVGAGTHADVHTNTSAQAKTGTTARSDDHAGTGIVARIDDNPELASRVQTMLPSGMSMSSAAAGFRNEGQFLAALHASQNLNIPFSELKTKMNGSEHMSLGEAIKSSKPNMTSDEAKEGAKKAEKQAKVTASAKASASAAAKVRASDEQ